MSILKRSNIPEVIPPSLTKEQGLRVLKAMKEKGETLQANRPIEEAAFKTWSQGTWEYLSKTFGSDSGHLRTFAGQGRIHFCGPHGGPDERYLEQERVQDLSKRI